MREKDQMDYTIFFLLLSFTLTIIQVLVSYRKSSSIVRLPPGPYPFPIIGSIFKLGHKPHESFAALSKTYGPLMCVKLGSTTTIVVSSPKIAKEFLQKYDRTFSGRSLIDVVCVMDHHKFSMAWSPVGNQWQKLRRFCKEQLFSTQRLDASQHLRRKKVQQLVDYVQQCCLDGKAVNIGRATFTTSVNSLSNFIFSTDMADYDSLSSQEFKDTISELLAIVGKPNLVDFFPVLKIIDPQGLRRQGEVYMKKLFSMFEKIVNQRLETIASSSSVSNDVLDLVLDLNQKNDSEFSLDDILHLLLDLFVAATDTTSSTVEWAMSELIQSPQKMAKARAELEEAFGKVDKNGSPVQESDISKLPYLQAIVKETLRLHPPAPLLSPRKAESEVEVQGGFIVPKDAQILCNIWAMGRDPSVWLNPKMFVPERFLDCEMDFKGRDFELIPFGAGRRMCPGLPLADRMLHLILGSLIYSFDWKLEGEIKAENMDMSDKFGLTLTKAVPLKAIPIKVC